MESATEARSFFYARGGVGMVGWRRGFAECSKDPVARCSIWACFTSRTGAIIRLACKGSETVDARGGLGGRLDHP